MNEIITAILSFSLGLILAIFIFGCPVKAYEKEENTTTRFSMIQQQRELDRLQEQQHLRDRQQRNQWPCP